MNPLPSTTALGFVSNTNEIEGFSPIFLFLAGLLMSHLTSSPNHIISLNSKQPSERQGKNTQTVAV